MPDTQRRVLHGNQQCERLLDELARFRLSAFTTPVRNIKTRKNVHLYFGIDVRALMVHAFERFYRGTVIATCLLSAEAVIDVEKRTIILTRVRLKHRRKDLPKEVHDLRVY